MVLDIKDLTFGYDKSRVLYRDFNLKINRGEVVSVIGESGSGKSTLLELISNNLKPLSGEIKSGKIAWVFQDPYSSFHPTYTILEQIEDVASLDGVEALAKDMDIENRLSYISKTIGSIE